MEEHNDSPPLYTIVRAAAPAHRSLKGVAGLLDLLVGVDLLALLAQRGDLLLDLLELRLGDLGRRLLGLDLVAEGVELVLLVEALVLLSFSSRLRAFSAASIHSAPLTVQRPSTTDQTSGQSAE